MNHKTLHFTTRSQWRAWLRKHHRSETHVWLLFNKRHTGKPSMPYEDAVEEALCFGWIDSILRRIDNNTYARKFTPRNPASMWSALNVRRAKKLIRERRMTESGLTKFRSARVRRDVTPAPKEPTMPPFIRRVLRSDNQASENFNRLAPSYRSLSIRWIMDAKRQETRERRLDEFIRVLRQGKTLGLK